MLRFLAKRTGSVKTRLFLGLTQQRLALCSNQLNCAPIVELLPETSTPALVQLIDQLINQHLNRSPSGSSLQVLLSTDISRVFLATPYPGIRNFTELQALVALRFTQIYDEPSSNWTIQADWSANRPFLVAALPAEIINSLHKVCRLLKLKLATVLPYSLWQWNLCAKTLPESGSLNIFEACYVTQFIWQGPQVLSVRGACTSGVDPLSLAHTVLSRETLRLNLPELPLYAAGLRFIPNSTAAVEKRVQWLNQSSAHSDSCLVLDEFEPALWLAQQGNTI
ncbi:MAG: hypothetical protein K1X48_08395 [Burkholderiaceae bacterium]|nr:hypothetical protein [Burkholderiaceae bacterium]